ncbi:DUF927 domain-containing protein [Streptomyces sp. NPDC059534]|uniref:DUF927 domain-containing protein n=1 Tax=Streptomyces sp. NPDC059534 TaxID=3346859 RepID=UPI0036B47164
MSTSTEIPAQSPQRRRGGNVRALERDGVPPGCRSIAGLRRGWFYQESSRAILHQSGEEAPTIIGYVPEIQATVAHYTDDGEYIRTEYLARGKRQRNPRILTEDELDRGTWAAKCGQRRPTGNDEKHAFARIMREEGDKAPEVPARTYYNEAGDLIFPEAHAQTLGYRMLRGEEAKAKDAWEEIGYWTTECGKSALVQGAMFAGPVLDSLDVLAHMVNCFGPGQQGKSTILTICSGTFGDIKPRRQQLMITWNASKQGITQSLRQRGFLPLCLDEHSSSGRRIQESSREISQMVAGAVRAMGTADGSPRESDGFWLSCAVSSSNEPLKHEGQTEDLATRLQEFKAPFFPDKMLLPDGSPAPEGHKGAEHVSKRLKRLAKAYGGWPLEWAIRKGMFRAENLERIKTRHLELCSKYRPSTGGIAATIAELHMVWVVGAYMLGEAIGVPEIGKAAEAEAAARLADAITAADEANVPDHEKLWWALDALRLQKSAFPDMDRLPAAAEEGFRQLRGFTDPESGEWWVLDPVVQEASAQAGIDNMTAAMRRLYELGIHLREENGKRAQCQLPKPLRGKGLGLRMHRFNTLRAEELYASDEPGGSSDNGSQGGPGRGPGPEFRSGTTTGNHPGTTEVVPENGPLTSTGTTGTTGTTSWLLDFSMEKSNGPEEGQAEDAPDTPSTAPTGGTAPTAPTESTVPPVGGPVPPAREVAPVVSESVPPVREVAPAKARHTSKKEPVVLAQVRAVTAEGLFDPATGTCTALEGQAVTDLVALVDVVADSAGSHDVTLVVDDEVRARYGLNGPRPGLGKPWHAAFLPLVEAGWHQPRKAGLRPRVQPTTSMEHPKRHGHVRITVAAWLKPTEFPMGPKGDTAGAARMAERLVQYAELVRWSYTGTAANTAIWALRGCLDATRKTFVQMVPKNSPEWPTWQAADSWSRPLTDQERAHGFVIGYDAIKNYLPAYGQAIVAGTELVHETGGVLFDEKMAGLWLMRVPEWPHALVPAPVHEVPAGKLVWVTTAIVKLYVESGISPEVMEAWIAPAVGYQGFRDFTARLRDGLKVVEARTGDTEATILRDAMKATYRTLHGKLRNDDQFVIARPDWGYAVRDEAWTGLLRKVYRGAGILGKVDVRRYPIAVNTDELVYATTDTDPRASVPAGLRLAPEGEIGHLGQFRPKTAMTTKEWEESRG